jgi:hypothetical protein
LELFDKFLLEGNIKASSGANYDIGPPQS